MPYSQNGQLHTKIANKVWFERDPVGSTYYGALEFGIVREAASPSLNADTFELRDPANCNSKVWEDVNQVDEEWVAKIANISMPNLAMYFLANPATTIAQAATQLTDVLNSNNVVGQLVKLKKADGTSIYNLTSVDAVKDASDDSALTLGTDYEVVDLEAGIIKILAGGDSSLVADAAINLKVTMTPVAIDMLQIAPQTKGILLGTGWIQMQSPCGAEKWMRHTRMAVRPSSTNFTATDASDIDFTLAVLADLTSTTKPAGTLTKFKGTMV